MTLQAFSKIFSVAGLMFISSCSQKKQSFTQDLPPDSKGEHSLFSSMTLIRDSLYLDTIENGYDSLQIRVWLAYSFTYNQQLIVIKKNSSGWHCFYYEFKPLYKEYSDSLVGFEKNAIEKYPKVPWSTLTQSLYSNEILTLPDCNKIKDYVFATTDPNSITIEVASRQMYRLYSFVSPHFVTKIPEALKIENIINVLTKQFDIQLRSPI